MNTNKKARARRPGAPKSEKQSTTSARPAVEPYQELEPGTLFASWERFFSLRHYRVEITEAEEAGKTQWKESGFITVKKP